MFNWFRRNEKAQQPPETTPEVTAPEVTTDAEESSAEPAEPDYLAFAKAAYKNIQERKGEAQQIIEPVVEPEKTTASADVAEASPESTETPEKEIEEVAEVKSVKELELSLIHISEPTRR
jgi:fused signal recognition particle receptor